MLGIAISNTTVTVVQLGENKSGLYLQGYAFANLPDGLMDDNNIQATEAVGMHISQLISELPEAPHKKAAVALPNATLISKVIQLPTNLTEEDLATHIRLEAANHIPFPLSEVSLDYVLLQSNSNEPLYKHTFNDIKSNEPITYHKMLISAQAHKQQFEVQDFMQSVLIIASRTEQVEQRVDALVFAGLTVKVVDAEAHALQRSLQYILQPSLISNSKKTNPINLPFALVYITEKGLTLYVFEGNEHIYSREHRFCHENGWVTAVTNGNLDMDVDMVSNTLMSALQFYLSNANITQDDISHIFLSGEVFSNDYENSVDWVTQLVDTVVTKVPSKVMMANPFVNMACAPHINQTRLYEHAPMLLTAFGLALREDD